MRPAPHAGMSGAHRAKLGAVGFVTALFRAGVVPAAVIKGCLSELLEPVGCCSFDLIGVLARSRSCPLSSYTCKMGVGAIKATCCGQA